ncbi:MAG: heme NO-binding domain-containing protein [Campylobacterales bacterium]|nr:heme NO-binding domain-containing protein [Campylobacterales bacterium]
MKGLVFTELVEFIEEALGFDVADMMIEKANLAHGGAFTQAGNYPFEELLALVVSLSEVTQKSIPDLLFLFGEHLFERILALYPMAAHGYENVINFVATVDDRVHVEVKKTISRC